MPVQVQYLPVEGKTMTDVLFILLLIVSFAATLGLIRGLDSLQENTK
jgi:hypothetical protein